MNIKYFFIYILMESIVKLASQFASALARKDYGSAVSILERINFINLLIYPFSELVKAHNIISNALIKYYPQIPDDIKMRIIYYYNEFLMKLEKIMIRLRTAREVLNVIDKNLLF